MLSKDCNTMATNDQRIHGVNLLQEVDLAGEFVEKKNPFWRFPVGVVEDRKTFDDFIGEVQEHHMLIEAFSLSNAYKMFALSPPRLLSALLYCEMLKVLQLRNCNLGSMALIEPVAKFMEETPTCSSIDLSGNRIPPQGTQRICQALDNNTVILEFTYRENGVNNQSIAPFKDAIRGNSQMEFLDLSYNVFNKEGERYLVDGIRANGSLKKLKYDHIKDHDTTIIEKTKVNKLNWREKFIKNLTKEETGKWNRSKLMFIGQGRAGKTSTVNRLLNKGFDNKQDSTIGASVSQTQTSTTANQEWQTIRENDPDYLGTGMLGNQAGQLFAARKLVDNVDTDRQKKLAARKKRGLQAGKQKRDMKINEQVRLQAQGNVAVDISSAAKKLLEEQQERDNAANKLFLEQEKLRQQLEGVMTIPQGADMAQLMSDEQIAKQLQAQEEYEARLRKEEKDKDEETAKHYADTVFAAAREKRDTITFSLWDYGGQSVFYALHHLFLTKYGVYVLCVNVKEIVDSPEVAKEYLLFWLNSVKLHAPTAPVLLVGTQIDRLEDKALEILEDVNTFIKDNFKQRFRQITSLHPKYHFYPVDNKNNKGVNELRFDIERISRKQEFVTADVSVKWMFCLDKIMVKRDSGGQAPAWMKLSDVKRFAESVNLTTHEEVERMLTMFHELGVLVRLTGTEELRNLVTLDPQWLLDGLCKVIRDEKLHGPPVAELEKVGLKKEMALFFKSGLASDDVLRYLWSEPKFKDHHNYLVDLMKYMVLISDWDFREEKMYIIPSLLIPRPEDVDLFDEEHIKEEEEIKKGKKKNFKIKNIFKKKKKEEKKEKEEEKVEDKGKQEEDDEEEVVEKTEEITTDYVLFDFSKVFLPMGVFQRLVCMCVSYSTNVGRNKKKLREPELYARWAKIWMGNDTILYLEQKDNTIWLSVEEADTGPTCFKAVNSMLTKLNADLMGSGLEWEISMRRIKKTICQKKDEKKAHITELIERDMLEKEAKSKKIDPWYKQEKKTEVEASKQEELLDLEDRKSVV